MFRLGGTKAARQANHRERSRGRSWTVARTKGEVPLFVFGQGLSFKVARSGRLMFGFPAGLRNAFLRRIHRSGTGLSDLMSPVQSQHVSCGRRRRSAASEGQSSVLFSFLSPRCYSTDGASFKIRNAWMKSQPSVCWSLLFPHNVDNVVVLWWPLRVWETKTIKTIGLPHAPEPLLTLFPLYNVPLFTSDMWCLAQLGSGLPSLSL